MNTQPQTPRPLQSYYQQLKKKQLKRFKLKYQYPATLTVAEHHQSYKRICKVLESSSKESAPLPCACCQLPIHTQQIQVCSHLFQTDSASNGHKANQSKYLNSNVSIVFHILKTTIIFYLFRTILTQTIKVILFKQSKYCADNQSSCKMQNWEDFIALPFTIYHNSQLLQIEAIINGFAILISIVLFLIYRHYLFIHFDLISSQNYYQDQYAIFVNNVSYVSLIEAEMNQDHQSQAFNGKSSRYLSLEDLCINRSDLPFSTNSEALIKSSLQLYFIKLAVKIKETLQKKCSQNVGISETQKRLFNKLNYINNDNLKQKQKLVKEIVLCYDFTEIERLEELIQSTMLEFEDSKEDNKYQDSTSLNYTPNRVKFLSEKLRQLQANYSQSASTELFLSRFLGCAFVSFEFSEFKDYLLDFHQNNLRVFYDDTIFLSLKEPQVPQKLNWHNLNLPSPQVSKSHNAKCFIIFFFLALLLIITALLKIWFWQSFTTAMSLPENQVLGCLIMCISYNLLTRMIQRELKSQLNSSYNDYRVSRLIKGSLFASLLLVLTTLFFSQAYKRGLSYSKQILKIITRLFGLFLSFQTLYHVIPVSYFWAMIKQARHRSHDVIYKFQTHLNQQLQLKQFDVIQVLIFQMAAVWFSSFFYHIAPFNAFTCAGLLFVNYWVFKVYLIRFYSVPNRITFRLVQIVMHLLQLEAVILALGFCISVYKSKPASENSSNIGNIFSLNISVQQWANLQLAIIILFKLITLIWPKKTHINTFKNSLTFSQVYQAFPYYYGIQSPATKFTNNLQAKFTSRYNVGYDAISEYQIEKKPNQIVLNSIDIQKSFTTKKKGLNRPKNGSK